jgi:hypothetical protein
VGAVWPPAAVFIGLSKYFFSASFFQFWLRIFDTVRMAQSTRIQLEGIAQVAGRILIAWHSGENASLKQELEHARCMAAHTHHASLLTMASTLEMERLEVLSGIVESLQHGREQAGAVRLLEHLASPGLRAMSAVKSLAVN